MRHLLLATVLLSTPVVAQIQDWDPEPYSADSGIVFHDDLDFYLNAYSKEEIKQMRHEVGIWRMNFDKMMRATINDLRTYSEGGNMDPHTHDFTLPDARTGLPYHLVGHPGKVRAFMFVSMSNPPARMQLGFWDKLHTKYDTARVELFVIYGKELHPGDKKSFRAYPVPTNAEEKLGYARDLAKLTQVPVLVDGLDDAVLDLYGRVPNGAFVIDDDDRLVFRETWADSRKIEHIIDTLLKWYDDGRPALPRNE